MAEDSKRTTMGVKPTEKELVETEVQSFDFVRTTKITNEQQISFKMATERLARSVERKLSSIARVPAQVTIESTENMPFADFTDLLGDPCAAYVFRTGDTGAEGAVDMGAECAFYLIDRLFGGSGDSAQQARPLSELEQSVVRGVAERMLEALKSGWSEHMELQLEIAMFASRPEDLRAKDRGEAFVTRLAVSLESLEGHITIALPLQALESILQREHSGARSSDRFEAREYRSAIERDLKHARLSLSARLAPLSLTARTLADLSVGQVIQTNQHVDTPIEVHINGQRRFLGTLGQVRKHVGVQLAEANPGVPTGKTVRTTSGRIL